MVIFETSRFGYKKKMLNSASSFILDMMMRVMTINNFSVKQEQISRVSSKKGGDIQFYF
jgi:hypothetical protein